MTASRPALQQAVGEAARRCADIEAAPARRIDAEGRRGRSPASCRRGTRSGGARRRCTSASSATICPGFCARAPSPPMRTSPASTAAAARERVSNRPRSARSVSSLRLATPAGYRGASVTRLTVDAPTDAAGRTVRTMTASPDSSPRTPAPALLVATGTGLILAPFMLGLGHCGGRIRRVRRRDHRRPRPRGHRVQRPRNPPDRRPHGVRPGHRRGPSARRGHLRLRRRVRRGRVFIVAGAVQLSSGS